MSLALLFIVWAQVVSAQAPAASFEPADSAQIVRANIQKVTDPTLRSPVSPPTLQMLLEGDADERAGLARVGVQYGDFLLDLKLRSPLNDPADRALLADLEGLRHLATADIGTTWIRWEPRDPAPVLLEICRDYASSIGKDVKQIDCRLSELRKLKIAGGRTLADEALARIDPGVMLFLGARLRAGRKRFAFVDRLTLNERAEMHSSYAATLSAAVLTRRSYFFGFNYRHEMDHLSGRKIELCLPLGSIDGLRCSEATLGAPLRLERELVQLEARKFVGGALAFNPKVTRDFSTRVTGLELPVFFLRNKDRGFTGGVVIGWRSDTRAVTMTAFVGQMLGLLTQP